VTAYAVDAINVRAKEVAAKEIIGPVFENTKREKEAKKK
jgi:hypothetical protein